MHAASSEPLHDTADTKEERKAATCMLPLQSFGPTGVSAAGVHACCSFRASTCSAGIHPL
eukprot:scaffold216431_cov15-Tisochrysis_lutea.AAC.1